MLALRKNLLMVFEIFVTISILLFVTATPAEACQRWPSPNPANNNYCYSPSGRMASLNYGDGPWGYKHLTYIGSHLITVRDDWNLEFSNIIFPRDPDPFLDSNPTKESVLINKEMN